MKKSVYSERAAERAVKFFRHLRHTKGRWANKPFILAPWQENDIIRPLFGTLKPDGTRQYQTAYIEIPRKNGKSEIAAGIALYLLLADREQGAEIYGAAGDRNQAAIVFNIAAQMVRQDSIMSKRSKIIDSSKRIIVYKTASFYHAVSADVPTKHGFNPHGVIFDELHTQPNRQLWDVLTTGFGTRRQPLVVAITTAGYDRYSICYEVHDYAKKVLSGVIDDPTFFAYIRAAEEKDDWTSEKTWKKANPALGDFLSMEEMRRMAKQAREIPAFENTFRRYRLNQWTRQDKRWLPLEKWDATAGEVDPSELLGMKCYAGLDMASTTDIAALVLVFPFGESFKVMPFFFVPAENAEERSRKDRVPYMAWIRAGHVEATEGNVIDYKAIKQKILLLATQYQIEEIAFDRWGMTQLSQELDDEGFTMVPFGQGFASMSAPSKELLGLVLAKRIQHGNNPVLRWMADNLMMREDPAANIKPDKSTSKEKIDGMVAMIMGLDRALRHKRGGSVYDDRGLRSV